ncbi:MAG: lipid-A-disaccharide synthase N-terminal domain-containing protein, partial [Planctomycetota bacterium]
MNRHLFDFFLFNNQVIITPWKIVGLVGVSLFTARWLVQVYYSHKIGRPVTPRVFWILSMVGSLLALSYFIFSPKPDMVGILGYLFPSLVAA